ncbi:hypothetical protein UCDDS831_g01857 [Diplodia seriata]|uniref:Uncharacterized protein n=1 Tax=Diplodia seriata TaxID=420778 RepID=A0A0G2EU62_9PEZI|nr:hypothetical protein UCDDS831_g01857 [Diplodia seriata]
MMWACIASVTEAISLNGYQPQTYLSPQFAGGDLEDREFTPKSFGMTEIEQKKAQEAIKEKMRKQRIGKKLFSFYKDEQLQNAQDGCAVDALRAQEPIFIPLDWRHLIYATARDVEATDPVPEITHYWMEGLGGSGLPIGQEKRDLEAGSERVLKCMNWWGRNVVFEHTWQPITPVDHNLVLSPIQEREVSTLHLLLTAWTLALGFRPPSTVVLTKEHSSHYRDIKTLFNLASCGFADAATIFAALRCVGWISDAVVPPAPPESVRFDQTALMQDSEIQKAHYNRLWALLHNSRPGYLHNLAIETPAARRRHAANVNARERLEEKFESDYGQECPDDWPEDLEQSQMADDLLKVRAARGAEAKEQNRVEDLQLRQTHADEAVRKLLCLRAGGSGDGIDDAFPESLAAIINAEDQRVGYWDAILIQEELRTADEKLEEARWAFADALARNQGVVFDDDAVAYERLPRGDARKSAQRELGKLEWGWSYVEGEKLEGEDNGKKRPWEAYEEETRLVVDVDSEVYGQLKVRADRGGRGLHTV